LRYAVVGRGIHRWWGLDIGDIPNMRIIEPTSVAFFGSRAEDVAFHPIVGRWERVGGEHFPDITIFEFFEIVGNTIIYSSGGTRYAVFERAE